MKSVLKFLLCRFGCFAGIFNVHMLGFRMSSKLFVCKKITKYFLAKVVYCETRILFKQTSFLLIRLFTLAAMFSWAEGVAVLTCSTAAILISTSPFLRLSKLFANRRSLGLSLGGIKMHGVSPNCFLTSWSLYGLWLEENVRSLPKLCANLMVFIWSLGGRKMYGVFPNYCLTEGSCIVFWADRKKLFESVLHSEIIKD